MKTIPDHNILGFTIAVFGVPESAEEFDTLAGRKGACLDDATDNVLYRGYNADFRKAFATAMQKETAFERKVVGAGPTKKDGSAGAPRYESEKDYLNRYIADQLESGSAKSVDEVRAALQPLATAAAGSLKFDPKPASRTASGPGKMWLDALRSTLAGIGDTPENRKRLATNAEANNPGLTVDLDDDGIPTDEALANAIKVNSERKAKESAAELAGPTHHHHT